MRAHLQARVLTFCAIAAAPIFTASAQQAAKTAAISRVATRATAPSSRSANAVIAPRTTVRDTTAERSAVRIVAAAVAVNGRPGSLEVVGIPLPSELNGATAVRYVIIPAGRARVIGKTEGTLSISPDSRPRVLFTVSAPVASTVGRVRVAMAEFSAAQFPTVEVPVELIIAPTHRVEFALVDQLVGARAGNVAVIRGRITNFGNQTDTARIRATLPQGWRDLSGAPYYDVPVAPRESRDVVLRVWVPPQAPSGTSVVRLMASLHGAPIASSDANVQVGGRMGSAGDGPTLSLASVAVAAPGAAVATGISANLDGAISDSIRIRARADWIGAPSTNASSQSGFARAGIARVAPTVEIESPRVRLGVGTLGRQLSELAGTSLSGTGVVSEVGGGRWRTTAVAMRPYTPAFYSDSARGQLLATQLRRHTSATDFTISASHLSEPLSNRELSAVSGGFALRSASFGELNSEIGYRRSGAREGYGYLGEFRRTGESGMLSVRALHAPGGSMGFARANDEINIVASRNLTDFLNINGGFWKTGDEAIGFGKSASRGWSVGPTVQLLKGHASISAVARSFEYSASSSQGGFGSAERQASIGIDLRNRRFHVNSSSLLAAIEKSTRLGDMSLPSSSGARAEHRVMAGMSLLGGSFDVNAMTQEYAGEVSAIPRQTSFGVRFDRMPVSMPFGMRPVFLASELQSVSVPWAGSEGQRVMSARVAASTQLFAGMGVTVSSERNPYLTTNSGARSSGWITTLRVDRTSVLPRLVGAAKGSVYRDLNANGARDKGEEGVAGVVVRCNSLSVVTDANGRYACAAGSEPKVDPRSLPMGWLSPALRNAQSLSRDVGLVSVEAVTVNLRLDGLDSTRVSSAELLSVQVIARDSLGLAWMARSVSAGIAVFDALPPGRYVLEVDASGVAEPLRLMTANPRMDVRAERNTEALILVLRGRDTKVRVFTPSSSSAAPSPKPSQNPSQGAASPRTRSRSNLK